ncbi:hypothetical protein ES705_29172 [subsurface metagenome]
MKAPANLLRTIRGALPSLLAGAELALIFSTCYNRRAMGKKKKPFTPGPFFCKWWGPLADQVWKTPAYKGNMYPVTRRAARKHTDKSEWHQCPCKAFTLCDKHYQQMNSDEKKKWKDALKKPGMSAYELYMKECLCSLIGNGHFPYKPSQSGGFSCRSLIPGPETPPGDWIGHIPPVTRYSCSGPPFFECFEDPEGEYENMIICQLHCLPDLWTCSGSPEWKCTLGPGEGYARALDCLAACIWDPPPKPGWDCPHCTGHTTPKAVRLIINGLVPPAPFTSYQARPPQWEEDDCHFLLNLVGGYIGCAFEPDRISVDFALEEGTMAFELPIETPRNCFLPHITYPVRGSGWGEHQPGATCTITPWNPLP